MDNSKQFEIPQDLKNAKQIVFDYGFVIKGTNHQYSYESDIAGGYVRTDNCIHADNIYRNFEHNINFVYNSGYEDGYRKSESENHELNHKHNQELIAKVAKLAKGLVAAKDNHMKAFDRFEGVEYSTIVSLLREFGIEMAEFDETVIKKSQKPLFFEFDDSKYFKAGILNTLFKETNE
jgi:hypothetical protein